MLLRQVYPEETYQDIIGSVYMALGVADKKNFGQFFTPFSVAKLMAAVTMDTTNLSQYTAHVHFW